MRRTLPSLALQPDAKQCQNTSVSVNSESTDLLTRVLTFLFCDHISRRECDCRETFSKLHEYQNEIDKKVDAISHQFSTIDSFLEKISSRLSQVETHQKSMELKLKEVEDRCKSSEELFVTQESELRRVSTSLCLIDDRETQHFSAVSESSHEESLKPREELIKLKQAIDRVSSEFSSHQSKFAQQLKHLSLDCRGRLDSTIISGLPAIFEDFRTKSIRLLYRGSRDGFSASDFHRCCDKIPNTLTLLQTTKGSIFGGFTPIAWSSGPGENKYDSSCQSFVFSLKNPWNRPAQKFSLKSDPSLRSIHCDSSYGPVFGDGSDFGIENPLNGPEKGWSNFWKSYTNDTGIDSQTFFDGQFRFTVKEIEVFEIHG
jgi:hypothetical protein